ncbi:MAG: hypothetical protein IH616_01340 [Gemmatimonadales bacterium]|nr:hypothetical protein [Gemmatimonadales bacterium]
MTVLAQIQVFPPTPGIPMFVWFEQVGIPILAFLLLGFVSWQAFRTLNRYLDRKHGTIGAGDLESLRAEVETLRSQVGTVEDLTLRLGEVEERVDFAERLLTKERERRAQLEAGS